MLKPIIHGKMDVKKILHMQKEGDKSYARNSSFQKFIISTANAVVTKSVSELFEKTHPETMGIADLGCSSGNNSLLVISNIINSVYNSAKNGAVKLPEIKVSLNDLTSNDFNGIFRQLPEFYSNLKRETGFGCDNCFVSCVGGSYFGRLFPRNSLHFVHSSMSLHWLSQVPEGLLSKETERLNGENIYVSKTSPEYVVKAYLSQFEKDLYTFLRSRAVEVVEGGRMVLYYLGRNSPDPAAEIVRNHWDLTELALKSMVDEGIIEKEKLESFNFPHYAPSVEEVEEVIKKEGSFSINQLETYEVGREGEKLVNISMGQQIAKTTRAANECIFREHFGNEAMDELYKRLGQNVDEYYTSGRLPPTCMILVSVTRNHSQTSNGSVSH